MKLAEAVTGTDTVLPDERAPGMIWRSWTANKASAACLAALALVGGCATPAPREAPVPPKIQVEYPGTPAKTGTGQRAGQTVPALVCRGYAALDGNRLVQNPIVNKKQVDRGDFTPMRVNRHYDVLDIEPSIPQDNLQYYKNGQPLAEGQRPNCFGPEGGIFLKIMNIKTNLPNYNAPGEPNVVAFHMLEDAFVDEERTVLKAPGHVYDLSPGKDPSARDHLVHIETVF